MRWSGQDHQLCSHNGVDKIVGRANCLGDPRLGQVTWVDMFSIDGLDHRWVMCPELNLMPGACQHDSERRPPTARTNDCNTFHSTQAALDRAISVKRFAGPRCSPATCAKA